MKQMEVDKQVYGINPFSGKREEVNRGVLDVLKGLTSSEMLMVYYIMINNDIDTVMVNRDDFKEATNIKSNTTVIQSINTLLRLNIIAKTNIKNVYWLNNQFFKLHKQ